VSASASPRTPARSRVVRAGAAVTTARLASLSLAAVQVPLVARLVPGDLFATVPLTVQVATLVGLVLADPAVLAFQRHPGDAGDRTAYRWAVQVVTAVLCSGCAALVVAGTLAGVTGLVVGAAGWALGLTANRLSAVAWLAWGHEWRYTASLVGSTALRTGVLLAALLAGVAPWTALALAGAASALLAVALAPRTTPRRDGTLRPRLALGAGLAVGQLGLQLLGSAPLVVASALLGTTTTATLGAATQVALLLGTVLNLVTTVAYPRLRRRWDEGAEREVLVTLRLLVLACATGGAAALVLTGAGHGALPRLVLTAPLTDGALVAALVTASCASSIALVASWAHQFRLLAGRLAGRSLATASTTVVLVAVGTTVDGVRGAATGGLVGMLVHVGAMTAGSGVADPASVCAASTLAGVAAVGIVAPGTWAAVLAATGTALLCLALLVRGVVVERADRIDRASERTSS